jgi:hypothetical protein
VLRVLSIGVGYVEEPEVGDVWVGWGYVIAHGQRSDTMGV